MGKQSYTPSQRVKCTHYPIIVGYCIHYTKTVVCTITIPGALQTGESVSSRWCMFERTTCRDI